MLWEAVPLSKVKPLAVEMWIKGLNLAPKSKGHVRSVMHILFEWAMRWELMEYNRNPMSLLKLKGLTKRVKQPRALSVEELQSLWAHLGEDMKVQQELLRHSDIRTTMNIYTHTVSPALREANSKVVRMILPERKTA